MLNQEFSSTNFRTIFELENRKGIYLEDSFFPDVESLTKKIRTAKSNVKQCLRQQKKLQSMHSLTPSPILESIIKKHELRLTRRYNKLSELKDLKAKELDSVFETLSTNVSNGKIDLALTLKTLKNGKNAYTLVDNAETFFPVKQVQYNLAKTFNCKQGNRKNILLQLHRCLSDTYEKLVLKTDIKSFYESIPRDKLLALITRNNLLSIISKNTIFSILSNYSTLSGEENGIPRGVGVSANLAEIYMTTFDNYLRNLPDVIFYSRYVDDIVVIFDKKTKNRGDENKYIDFISSELSNMGLTINSTKTDISEFPTPGKELEYLGYQFRKHGKGVVLDIGMARLKRYKEKIDRIFREYDKSISSNEKKGREDLILRLNFLTKNTHLVNNKRKAMIGIYFSNELLTTETGLKAIDRHLRGKTQALTNTTLKERTKAFSFLNGYRDRSYRKFSTKQLSKIVKAWKYGI